MKIYKSNGAILIDVPVDDNSYRHREIMGDNSLTLYFPLAEHLEIPLGAYVEFEGERYSLNRPEALKMQHSRFFEYTVTLESGQARAKIWKFRNPVDGRLKFSLTAKPQEHLKMFVDNMNIRDKGWEVGKYIDSAEKCINYDHAYCWDALGQMAEEFDTEFEIVGKTVSLHKVEYNKTKPLPLSYGKGNGFVSGVGRSNYNDTPPIEILYAQGGTDNIDASEYGSSELHLPKNGTLKYDGERFEDENGFDGSKARTYVADDKGFSIRRLDKTLSTLAEDSLDCTEIYPKRMGSVTEVVCVNKDNNFYDIIDSSIPDTLNYEDCLIEGETMTIIFQSGMLSGKEFEVKYYHEAKDTKEGKKKGRRFEIVPQEIDGQTMPNETFCPKNGNSYAVFHCMLPEAYINSHKTDSDPKTGAEWDMMRQCVRYLYDNEEENFTFTGTLDGIWAKRDWVNIGGKILLGGYVLFTDARFQKEGALIRIIGIKDYINSPHSPELELSNSTVTGSFGTTLQTLTSSEVIAEDYHRDALQFTKRRFRDAKETLSMLEQALLDNFTNSVTPISVQTMAMLVGDESLQFRFVDSKEAPNVVELNITYDNETQQIHCPAAILQHLTMGIDSISPSHEPSEYRFWDMEEYTSGTLGDGSKKYYLYAKVTKGKKEARGTFMLSEKAIKIETNDDLTNYYLLVGILNSEYDGERSFVPLYGFTEILPGRITTDRIVSSEGNSYFDLIANAMKLGDVLDFNSAGDGKLRLKGTIVQSLSGDSNYIGCYRGVYNSTYTYFQGDEVSYTIEGCTSTYRYIYPTEASGIAPTDTDHWQVIAQGSEGQAGADGKDGADGIDGKDGADGIDGKDGISPNTAYKSTVFKRANTAPSTPRGGTYANPVPGGWSDGIPSGERKLWASTRIFSSDGLAPQQSAWTAPRQMTDMADFDVEFSSVENPTAPSGHPNTNTQWSNESNETTIWMATSRKRNGLWEDWQVSRIKGEKGQDGTSISIKGSVTDWKATPAEAEAEGHVDFIYCAVDKPFSIVYWNEGEEQWESTIPNAGDAYIVEDNGSNYARHLLIAVDGKWKDAGLFKGEQGNAGEDGKSAYVHIKYAKSLTTNDWSDNSGETPAAYIGIYCDNSPTDKLDWSLYQWSKWQGDDGFGYEYIYQRTTTNTAPSTPTSISLNDDYVPNGWTDDPSGVSETYPYEWVCYRKKTYGVWGAFVGSSSNNAKAALWAKYGADGADGADGDKGDKGDTGATGDYTELRFAKNGSTTTPPALTNTLANPTGWSTSTPAVGIAEYLWMTSAQKSSAGVLKTNWTTPVRISGINGTDGKDGKDGADGKSPAMVFRGDYNHAATYYGTSYRLDCVRYNGAYYIARIDAGEFSSIAPPDSTKWNAFGGSFESVATQLLLAENANIAGWIFKDGKLYSQNGLFFLNGASGEFGGIIRSSLFFSNSKVVTLNQSSYTQVEIKPEEDFAQWYIINEPKTKTYIILPKASDWDGLELSFFIKQSNWQYGVNTTHIKTSNNEYMYCKMNIYNMWSSDGTGKIYTLENFNNNYIGTKNGYWMMQPNMPVKFKSILGAWYCIDGLWTGE